MPPELQLGVESIARKSHKAFKDRFPSYEGFRDAVAECWLKQIEGFREEMAGLGFTEVPSGTKASELNKAALAILTESGSLVFVGPGAFDKEGTGGSLKYTKIPLRSEDSNTPPDTTQSEGFVFVATPKVGEQIRPRQRAGYELPFIHTSDVYRWMMKPTEKSAGLATVNQAGERAVARFTQAQEETGLAPVRPKK